MSLRWLAAGALGAFMCQAQMPAPKQPEPEIVTHQSPASFSSRVNLVSVPVVVRDHAGHAIGGLQQDDFQLFDKGKRQAITKFSIRTDEAAPPKSTSPPLTPDVSTEGPTVQRQPKPVLPDRYVAYVFDDAHMKPADLATARQAANRYLDTALDSGTRAGIFTSSGRTTQGFTDDVAELHEAVNKVQPWNGIIDPADCLQISYYLADYLVNHEQSLSPFGVNSASPLAVEVSLEAATCHEDLWQKASLVLSYGMEETQSALRVLTDLIAKMGSLPGSRTIVLVSPGFILTADRRVYENQILESAVHAGVIINSLDARGVYTPVRTRTFDAERGGNFGGLPNGAATMLGNERQKADREEVFEAGNILHELADGTGGSVRDDNDLVDGLKQLASRPDYVYVLGFSPEDFKYDGSYHRLEVKLKEATKYDVEARRGYWAPSRADDATEAAREELKEAFFSRDEISDIPLDLHASFFKPPAGKAEINVVAWLDAKGLKFSKLEDRNNDRVTVITGLFDQNGNYISGIQRIVEMHLKDHSLELLEDAGIRVEQSFSVVPGRYIVRVVVKDSEGQTTAARNSGIDIP